MCTLILTNPWSTNTGMFMMLIIGMNMMRTTPSTNRIRIGTGMHR